MNASKAPDWEERFRQPGFFCGTEAVEFLVQHLAELPVGTALDVAMGEGRNALFLARHGFAVTGIEKSPAAMAKAGGRARDLGLPLTVIEADLENYSLPVAQFDLVLCFYYLQRSFSPALELALKPGGALVMEACTTDQLQLPGGPRHPDHLLQPGELYRAFRHLRVAYYREVTKENRAVASLLAYRI